MNSLRHEAKHPVDNDSNLLATLLIAAGLNFLFSSTFPKNSFIFTV